MWFSDNGSWWKFGYYHTNIRHKGKPELGRTFSKPTSYQWCLTHRHTHTHRSMHMNTCMHMHTHRHANVHMYAHKHTQACTHTSTCMRTCTHVCMALSMSMCPARLKLLEHTGFLSVLTSYYQRPFLTYLKHIMLKQRGNDVQGSYIPGPTTNLSKIIQLQYSVMHHTDSMNQDVHSSCVAAMAAFSFVNSRTPALFTFADCSSSILFLCCSSHQCHPWYP